jgi:hypothetical protein
MMKFLASFRQQNIVFIGRITQIFRYVELKFKPGYEKDDLVAVLCVQMYVHHRTYVNKFLKIVSQKWIHTLKHS